MWNPDWRKADDYLFCGQLNAGQWAWEFLRRNPEYQQDWAWFHSTWEKLEARYGKPPQRDFQAWQRDPEATRKVDDAAGDCRVDEDSVLIECWMGARWGFYKFPLDPAVDRPLIGEQLSWRPVDDAKHFLDASETGYLGADSARVALGFDLDMPLRAQLAAAKDVLMRRQARLRKTGQLRMRTVAELRDRWRLMIRLLDAQQQGEVVETVVATLGDAFSGEDAEALLREAVALRAGTYRQLAHLPEGRAG